MTGEQSLGVQVARWIAVVPIAFCAGLLANLLVGLALVVEAAVIGAFADRDPNLDYLMNAGIGAWVFVWAGAVVAPRGRLPTAVGLAALQLVGYGLPVAMVVLLRLLVGVDPTRYEGTMLQWTGLQIAWKLATLAAVAAGGALAIRTAAKAPGGATSV